MKKKSAKKTYIPKEQIAALAKGQAMSPMDAMQPGDPFTKLKANPQDEDV